MPDFAVGRLSITSGDELRGYLNKIKEMEQVQYNSQEPVDRAWEKNVIHLGGGVNACEQLSFSSILNGLKNTLENGNYNAKVYSFFKNYPPCDSIDLYLAGTLKLSPQELDYIINYDIKYRMGQEVDTDG